MHFGIPKGELLDVICNVLVGWELWASNTSLLVLGQRAQEQKRVMSPCCSSPNTKHVTHCSATDTSIWAPATPEVPTVSEPAWKFCTPLSPILCLWSSPSLAACSSQCGLLCWQCSGLGLQLPLLGLNQGRET
jgi:hypothetical protein